MRPSDHSALATLGQEPRSAKNSCLRWNADFRRRQGYGGQAGRVYPLRLKQTRPEAHCR